MIIFDILFVLAIVYILYKICLPEDYTEVDVIMGEYKDMKNKKR